MSDKVKLGDAPEKGGDGEKKAKLAALLKKARAGIKKQAENSEDKQKKEESASLSTPVVGDQIVQRVQDLVEGEGINKEEKAQHGAHTENIQQGPIDTSQID